MVVTGASSGIGRATAHAFAARGDAVVLAARSASTLHEVAEECRAAGGRALVVPTDVTDPAAVQALVGRAVQEYGRIDVWVGAAASWSLGRFEDTPADVFRQSLETTFFGHVHAARALLPQLRSQGHGVIVHIVSVYGRLATPHVASYVAAKWGLAGFSEVLRHELRDAPGIAVCTVLTGSVDTPIYRHAANYTGRRIRPVPPVLRPERVAEAVVRLADRPRPEVVVGRVHHLAAWTHDRAPWLYDRFIPAVDAVMVGRWPATPHDGTVLEPSPATNAVGGGWRRHDRRVVVGAGMVGLALASGVRRVRTALRGNASGDETVIPPRV